ncbi:hypothetical protein LguiB_026210 [Lonicera macranthoides]
MTGDATICCFNQEDRFLKRSLTLVDDYSRVAFHNCATMEYVAMCSDQLSLLLSSCHLGQPSEFIYQPKGVDLITIMAGLAATYGLNLNVLQAWVIWNLCNVENKLISVERILQYTKIESEAPPVIDNCRLELDWPINGRI